MAISDDIILDLRDAIRDDLLNVVNEFNGELNVTEAYAPAESSEACVYVIALNVNTVHVDGQDVDTEEYQIAIVVRALISDISDCGEIDPYLNVARAIQRRYVLDTRINALSTATAALPGDMVIVEKLAHPLFSQFLLESTNAFQSTTILTFRNWVDR